MSNIEEFKGKNLQDLDDKQIEKLVSAYILDAVQIYTEYMDEDEE